MHWEIKDCSQVLLYVSLSLLDGCLWWLADCFCWHISYLSPLTSIRPDMVFLHSSLIQSWILFSCRAMARQPVISCSLFCCCLWACLVLVGSSVTPSSGPILRSWSGFSCSRLGGIILQYFQTGLKRIETEAETFKFTILFNGTAVKWKQSALKILHSL